MKINSTRPRVGKPQEVLPAIVEAEDDETEIEVDEARDGNDLATQVESLPPEQQVLWATHTARLLCQMPADAQTSATGWFSPDDRNAMLVGGIGGFGAGALLAGLRATNNPYLVVAGTLAGGIAAGYAVSRFPKKRFAVKGRTSGLLGEVEFDFAAESETPPSK